MFSTTRSMLDSGSSPSASCTAQNILSRLARAQKSPINTGLRAQSSAPRHPAETKNSLSPAVFLQTSGLRHFSTDFVSIWKENAFTEPNLCTFRKIIWSTGSNRNQTRALIARRFPSLSVRTRSDLGSTRLRFLHECSSLPGIPGAFTRRLPNRIRHCVLRGSSVMA